MLKDLTIELLLLILKTMLFILLQPVVLICTAISFLRFEDVLLSTLFLEETYENTQSD